MLLIRVVTQPDAAESFSIYNPTDSQIDLADYYISDDEEYYKIHIEENLSPSGFTMRFPDIIISPGDTFHIVLNENYSEFYGDNFVADLVMFGLSDSSLIGDIGSNSNKMKDVSELIILFKWNDPDSFIEDVDYFLWGPYQTPINKTGISTYHNDTPIENQLYFEEKAVENYAYSRINTDEIDETEQGGNGITGNDETSENFRESWEIASIPGFIGCNDPNAENFSPNAVISDCSCEYNYPRFRICTYNILNFDSNSHDRIPYFQNIIGELCTDILTVQEMKWSNSNNKGEQIFFNEVISQVDSQYIASPALNHFLFNMLYYHSPFDLVSVSNIQTQPFSRDIREFILSSEQDTFAVYSLHLKAGRGIDEFMIDGTQYNVDCEEERLFGVQLLAQNVTTKYPYMIMGDFNIYTADEPAFQFLINDMGLVDPLNQIGDWHNNAIYKSIHTQSTRNTSAIGGASGGLDDRFDMILVSEGMNIIENTYFAFGNDGNHFNKSINYNTNGAVRQEMSDALYYASDHLPVCVDFTLSGCTDSAACNYNETAYIDNGSCEYPEDGLDCPGIVLSFYTDIIPAKYSLHNIYPNPFNPITHITYGLPENSNVQIIVYDLTGKQLRTLVNEFQTPGYYNLEWDASSYPSGVYFIKMVCGRISQSQKIILLK